MTTPSPQELRAVALDAARLAMQLQRAGRLPEAVGLYTRALRLDPDLVPAWCNLGVARRVSGDIDGAEDAFRETLRRAPEHPAATANLAAVLEARNRPDEARAMARRAQELAPDQPAPALVLARLARGSGECVEALATLDLLDPDALPPDLAPRYWTERGMTLDRLGRTDDAFRAFEAANEAASTTPAARAVDAEAYPRTVRVMREVGPALLGSAAPAEEPDAPPVFVLGFPRSGTTLTETILSAHPALRGSDEIPLLEAVLARLPDLLGRGPYPGALAGPLSADERRRLRDAYRAEASARLPAGPGRLVDKLPLNVVHVAAIAAIFPDAPIVFVLRDPRDVCLSNFMQDFVPNAAMVQMQRLETIVALQEQVLGLWRESRPRLPNPSLEVRYEDVVADQPGAARRLLEFLDLPWEDGVARFWETARGAHISTPSHQDVAKPIFTRARGRWRRYVAHLAPVLPRLDALAATWGYPSSEDDFTASP